MTRSWLFLAVLALSALVSAALAATTTPVTDFRRQLVAAINAKRADKGLSALCVNRKLMASALEHAGDMASNTFVKTKGTDGSTPTTRAKAQGFAANGTVSEAAAGGFKSADAVVAAWIKSTTTSATLFSNKTFIGPGYAYNASVKHAHYWAVDFASGSSEDCDE